MVINSGHSCTHIVPIIDGRYSPTLAKRIPVGGQHHTDLLSKSLVLKYPNHRQGLGYDQILDIQHNHSYCALNYDAQITYLERLDEQERLEAKKAEQVRHSQFLGDLRIQELTEEIELGERALNSDIPNKR